MTRRRTALLLLADALPDLCESRCLLATAHITERYLGPYSEAVAMDGVIALGRLSTVRAVLGLAHDPPCAQPGASWLWVAPGSGQNGGYFSATSSATLRLTTLRVTGIDNSRSFVCEVSGRYAMDDKVL